MAQLTVSIAASADDGETEKSGATYPPSGATSVLTTGSGIDVRKRLLTGTYMNRAGVFRFDTSSLPDTATVTGGTLRISIASIDNANSRNLNGEYLGDGAITTGDYAELVGTTAFSVAISTLTAGANKDFTLSNLGNISLTGYTKIRLGISGAAPTGTNEVTVFSWDHATEIEPKLIVDYTTPGGGGTTTPYINQDFIDRFKGGSNSALVTLWNPAWRAWTENMSARSFKGAMAMCYQGIGHDTEMVQKTMELLQRNGVKQLRISWDWHDMNFYNPALIEVNPDKNPEQLRQCYAYGITPIICLNQDPGQGTPWKVLTATVDNGSGGAVANGATTIRLTNIALGAGESGSPTIVLNRTGFWHANSIWPGGQGDASGVRPNYFITAFNSGTGIATLSRPIALSTGSVAAGAYNLYTMKMMPWKTPPSAEFDESWAIFRDEYMIPVLNIVATEYPSRAVILELWNELSFQFQWLRRGLWYNQADNEIKAGYQIMRNMRDWLENPANGWTAARFQNGISNTLPSGQSQEAAGSVGTGGHPYGASPLAWPYNISAGRTQLDAVGGNMSGGGAAPISTTTTGTHNFATGFTGSGVINVTSATAFPSTGYVQVWNLYNAGATLSYTGKTSSTLTGCTKISGPTSGTAPAGAGVYYHEWQPSNLSLAIPEWWLEQYAFESRIHNVQPGFVGSSNYGSTDETGIVLDKIKGRDVLPTEDTSVVAPGFVITESGDEMFDWVLKGKQALRWYASWISKGCKQLCLYGVTAGGPPGIVGFELLAPWLALSGAHTFPMTNGTITCTSYYDVLFYPHPDFGSSMGIGNTLMIGTDPTNLVTYTGRPNSTQFTGCNGGFGGSLASGTLLTLREGGNAIESIGRMSRFLSMAHQIPNLRTITIPQVSDSHDAVQWSGKAGDLTRFPHVYDRDVFFAQVLQLSSDAFALIYYVATRNYRAGNPDDGGSVAYGAKNFTVRLGGIRGKSYVKRKMDPLTGSTSFPVAVADLGGTSLDLTVEATDYPRMVLLREPMHSRVA